MNISGRRTVRSTLITLFLVTGMISLVSFDGALRFAAGAAGASLLGGIALLFLWTRQRARGPFESGALRGLLVQARERGWIWVIVGSVGVIVFTTLSRVVGRVTRIHETQTTFFVTAGEPGDEFLAARNLTALVDTEKLVAVRSGEAHYRVQAITQDLLKVNTYGSENLSGPRLAVAKTSDAWILGSGELGPGAQLGFRQDTVKVLRASPRRAQFTVKIEPQDSGPLRFKDSTEVKVVSPTSLTLSHVVLVESRRSSFFTRSVRFALLNASAGGHVDVSVGKNTRLVGTLCDPGCPSTEIQVWRLPRNSFYEAFASDSTPVVTTFEVSEDVSWHMRELRRGIAFSYLLKGVVPFRKVLTPILWVGTWYNLVMVLLGVAVTSFSGFKFLKWLIKETFGRGTSSGKQDATSQHPQEENPDTDD